MKYRIIQRGDGRYELQIKMNWYTDWHKKDMHTWDVKTLSLANAKLTDDLLIDSCTQYLFFANEILDKHVADYKNKRLKKQYKIIKEVVL